MVFGDELHTGGKALESDVLAKKLEVFRNLSEHVQLIGKRNVLSGSVQSNSVSDFYTVPKNTLYFIFGIVMADRNSTAGEKSAAVRIKGENPLLQLVNNSGTSINLNIVFSSPIILREDEVLQIFKNNTLTTHESNCSVVGYEVNKEVSIQ